MNKSKTFNPDECTIVAVRLRGWTGIKREIVNTMERLKLTRRNNCTLLKDVPEIIGMIKKSKDYITWGIIDDETKKLLIEKRGEKDIDGNLKQVFRLHPPIGGFERKGIKKSFTINGALGDRKEKINELIKKML